MSSHKFLTGHHLSGGIELNTMRTFVAIAETGSIVAAGKALGLTRSAAGKSLARLEAHLATRLLHRTTRSVSLTADGQYFYERCIQILTDIHEAESSIRQDNPQPKGTLRLTVTSAFGRIAILPLLNDFLEKWPDLDVEISFTDRLVDLVEEGFDLGIRMGDMPDDSMMVARPITRYRPWIYASPAYLQNHGMPENIAELGAHQRLIYGLQAGSGIWRLANDDGVEVSISGNRRLRFDSGEAIKDAAVEGMGIALMPSFLAADDLHNHRLVKLFPHYAGKQIPINAIYPNRKHLAAKIRQFIDMLVINFQAADSA
ncbi:DNA-binding transcriptional LysR family regulator [Erwinia toletana]|uniref:DNA-binding transcriptional LysR family regulator n=1 Tax=Winslowiella toletana TaxID=92490 RepID=A0ABS4PF22_9GAMM|nr:LysR family transcriptional regulator [Winslowiella toletana]MBP2171229.1 DNA-binding transcriptional LysR family regulator [Winslowiella toletana]